MKLNDMLLIAMRETRNYFTQTSEEGEYGISDGTIALQNGYLVNQWIAITGSLLNNGVYRIESSVDGVYTLSNGSDGETPTENEEAFEGVIYGLAVPRDFMKLCEEIKAFDEGAGKPTAYTSESVIGLHSWSRGQNAKGAPIGWREVFASRLAPFQRMFAQISI